MTTYRFEVRISIEGPVLSQAADSHELGIDTAARRAGDRPALPGNLIRGNLRHAWAEFEALTRAYPAAGAETLPWAPDYWLGNPSQKGLNNRPERARLRFDHDWIAERPSSVEQPRHRIRIDSATGAVARGMLQVIDSPFNAAEVNVFVGAIEADLEDDDEAQTMATRIRKGLEYAGSLGAMKTAGYGRICDVEVELTPVVAARAAVQGGPPLDLKATRFGLLLRFDRPICIARPHAGNNRYESEDHVPGSVLRGAIAARIFQSDRSDLCSDPRFDAICAHFRNLRIMQALPVPASIDVSALRRPVVPPFSLVEAPNSYGANHLYDVALKQQSAGLIHNRAPAFFLDWKWGGAADLQSATQCGLSRPAPARRIEVRTAIEPCRGVAKDSALFATEVVSTDEHLWLAEIDLADIPNADDRSRVVSALQALLDGPLRQIGKTKANANAQLLPSFAPHVQCKDLVQDGIACVCLQSAARLLPDPYGLSGTGGAADLFKRYAETWKDLSFGHLTLLRFFARQDLIGGGYLRERFWSDRAAYNPELLTSPGSVFVLRLEGDKAEAIKRLKDWRDKGLGQPTGAPGGDDWRANPYIRQNGFGEVLINLDLHWQLAPSEEAWHGLD
ncbi:conserved hypothetical protein [Thiocapsa sp. KS1]|nr:RAMP superfamily CRISPR-associated protein [Thiocapsa sp. KS1]CRI67874.1 conserved hypothetical protein [Thiocapsa sp. KS1]